MLMIIMTATCMSAALVMHPVSDPQVENVHI